MCLAIGRFRGRADTIGGCFAHTAEFGASLMMDDGEGTTPA
jgi:hypothetical protein